MSDLSEIADRMVHAATEFLAELEPEQRLAQLQPQQEQASEPQAEPEK